MTARMFTARDRTVSVMIGTPDHAAFGTARMDRSGRVGTVDIPRSNSTFFQLLTCADFVKLLAVSATVRR